MRISRTLAPALVLALASATVAVPVATATTVSAPAAAQASSTAPNAQLQRAAAILTATDRATQAGLMRAALADLKLDAKMTATLNRAIDASAAAGGAVETPEIGSSADLLRSSLLSVIDPDQYECNTTPLQDYVDNLLVPLEYRKILEIENPTPEQKEQQVWINDRVIVTVLVVVFGGADGPTYDTIVNADDPRFTRFGEGRDATNFVTRTVGKVSSFWDVPDRNLHLAAMKDDIVTSTTKADTTRYGAASLFAFMPVGWADDETALGYGEALKAMIDIVPWLGGGESDLFTFNAFALDPQGEDELFSKFGNQIVYGDGLLNAQRALGLDPVGVAAVIGHEFGHQIQYANGVFQNAPAPSPEGTRRTELMADAYGAYFAAHKAGMAYNSKKVIQAVRMSYEVGDCGFDSNGHHGTPLQRELAAEWGADLAADSKPKNVIPTKKLQAKFDFLLPTFIGAGKK